MTFEQALLALLAAIAVGTHHRRDCVNPAHLVAETHLENEHRKPGYGWCPKGHSLEDPSNVYEWRGKRKCRACHRPRRNAANRARRAARRAAA